MDLGPNPYGFLKKQRMDQEEPTTSSSSYVETEDKISLSNMDIVAADEEFADAKVVRAKVVEPLFITNLDPLICQNNSCTNPLKVPTRQLRISSLRKLFPLIEYKKSLASSSELAKAVILQGVPESNPYTNSSSVPALEGLLDFIEL